MKITDQPGRRVVEFDSLEDIHKCTQADTYHCSNALKSEMRRVHDNQDGEERGHFYLGNYGLDAKTWRGLTTHPQLDRFLERFKAFGAGEYLGQSMAKRRHRVFTEDDGDYIVERAGSDRPFESQRFHLEESRRRGQIDVVSEFGGTSALSNEQLEYAGFAACVLCDRLESDGFRVRIIGAHDNQEPNGMALRTVILKHHDEPLDIGRIGLVLATGPFFRTVIFRVFCKTTVRISVNMGASTTLSLSTLKHLDLSPTVILVPRMLSEQQAINFVKAQTQQVEAA